MMVRYRLRKKIIEDYPKNLMNYCPSESIQSVSEQSPDQSDPSDSMTFPLGIERRGVVPNIAFRHLHGCKRILAARGELVTLAAKSEQCDSVEDLGYFMEKPGLMKRSPHLVLMYENARTTSGASLPDAALLIHEFRPFGVPSGVFATTDRSGRAGLIGSTQDRVRYALRAADYLLRKGAKMVLTTVQVGDDPTLSGWGRCRSGVQWAFRKRGQPSFLPLHQTYEETLARLGQKTRANLRYYRRKAEAELGCRFLPQLQLQEKELLALNRDSAFPLADRVLRWRMKVLASLKAPYMMGLKDSDDRLLSVIAGRRFDGSTEILWQLNRAGLQKHSIVSAMRCFHIEHEISQGAQRCYVEGGTNHSMQHAFEPVSVTDLVMVRSRFRVGLSSFAKRYVPPDNLLAEMLKDPAVQWHSS